MSDSELAGRIVLGDTIEQVLGDPGPLYVFRNVGGLRCLVCKDVHEYLTRDHEIVASRDCNFGGKYGVGELAVRGLRVLVFDTDGSPVHLVV